MVTISMVMVVVKFVRSRTVAMASSTRMKTAMTEPHSGMYNAAYAAEMNGELEAEDGKDGDTPKAKAKGKVKAVGKPKAKATGKVKAAAKVAAAAADAETEAVEGIGDEDEGEVWDPLAAVEEDE